MLEELQEQGTAWGDSVGEAIVRCRNLTREYDRLRREVMDARLLLAGKAGGSLEAIRKEEACGYEELRSAILRSELIHLLEKEDLIQKEVDRLGLALAERRKVLGLASSEGEASG
jgi:hypothetical protein